MKSAKRTIALAISLLMVLTSLLTVNVFAADIVFPDVAEDYAYRQAIYSLVDDGIINGIEENGTLYFKPGDTVTRAQFAKMVAVYLKGDINLLTEKTYAFPDLAADHWANECIAYAASRDIIGGYPDGTFRPENPVTYAEAIKMLVCAKGYKSLYETTEPWHKGWIDIADAMSLTKGAFMLAENQAPRGLVAQLIYNMDHTKKLDPDKEGGINIEGNDGEEYEEATGVLVGAFNDTLEGKGALGLKRFEIMVDDTIYSLEGNKDASVHAGKLGKTVTVYYTDGSKKEVVKVEESAGNTTLTIPSYDIIDVDGTSIDYYDSKGKEKTAKLADGLYVIYNGIGVAKDKITSSFIKNYFNVSTGEITLMDNNGGGSYEVAFVTSYETYFVTGRNADGDKYTFKDKYTEKEITLTNDDEDECVVYKVSSLGGTMSPIDVKDIPTKDVVLSVAETYPKGEGPATAIVSSVQLKNATVETMSGYEEVYIAGKQYIISEYYEDLIDENADTYGFKPGDRATFYLDHDGKIVYMTKSEDAMNYGYLIKYGSLNQGSSLNSDSNMGIQFINKSGNLEGPVPLKDKIRFNGESGVDSSSIDSDLKATASYIAGQQTNISIENGEYAQLISYSYGTENGVQCIAELNTVNIEDGVSGIIPAPFRTSSSDDKEPFSTGAKLACSGTGSTKSFKDDGGAVQFIANSSTMVILVPKDRENDENFKKRTYSYFGDGKSYVAEPYDIGSDRVAKAVLVYIGDSSVKPDIYATNNVLFVQSKTGTTVNGKDMDKIYYYPAGSDMTGNPSEAYAPENGILKDINAGDLIRIAVEEKEIIELEKVFVGGKLYKADGSVATDYEIIESYNGDSDYYRVIHATVDTYNSNSGLMNVVLGVVTDNDDYSADNFEPLDVSKAKFYKWDKTNDKFTTEVSLGSLNEADGTDGVGATKVIAINKDDTIVAVYVLD